MTRMVHQHLQLLEFRVLLLKIHEPVKMIMNDAYFFLQKRLAGCSSLIRELFQSNPSQILHSSVFTVIFRHDSAVVNTPSKARPAVVSEERH